MFGNCGRNSTHIYTYTVLGRHVARTFVVTVLRVGRRAPFFFAFFFAFGASDSRSRSRAAWHCRDLEFFSEATTFFFRVTIKFFFLHKNFLSPPPRGGNIFYLHLAPCGVHLWFSFRESDGKIIGAHWYGT